MKYTFRPAIRENTPLIIGIAGPTKSGKTYSALRVATGLANGGTIAMINAEGLRGHQYADKFHYVTCDLAAPYRPANYTEALQVAASLKPAVVIIDSVSHMHDGPGGILEWHEEELDRMAGNDFGKRDKCNMSAWIKPKADENKFIYQMLAMQCPVILCLRAKEKVKMVTGKPIIDLGWQPIVGERVAFETIFTLMLPPHSKGIPDLSISDMREPFDVLVPKGKPIDESLGRTLAQWAAGGTESLPPAQPPAQSPKSSPEPNAAQESAFIWQAGKLHMGKGIDTIPLDYLEWYLSDKNKSPKADHVAAAKEELERVAHAANGGSEMKQPKISALCSAYLENITVSETVSECQKAMDSALNDENINPFEGQHLKETAERKLALLRG